MKTIIATFLIILQANAQLVGVELLSNDQKEPHQIIPVTDDDIVNKIDGFEVKKVSGII